LQVSNARQWNPLLFITLMVLIWRLHWHGVPTWMDCRVSHMSLGSSRCAWT
jgi:hypothetical protein